MLGVDILTSVIIHAGTSSSQGGGGGSSPPSARLSIATSASGNFDNAVKIGIFNTASTSMDFSNGVKDGSNSTFGTASNPTRTTQTIPVSAADYFAAWNANGSGTGHIMIGGYLRANGYTSANAQAWQVQSNTIQSQSFSTVTATVTETNNGRRNIRDNTNLATGFGIYNSLNSATGSGYYRIILQHGAGRGASTLPQAGDSITFRVSASDSDTGGNVYFAIHDVTINFT